ncbi:hypothetical protein TVAG_061590 [Trichomonas vaginalis G3]|uniref:Uncharacterized protein n=1 Tax=Trichomonas vaginalis (strain ATCC PRA-98 / G3) TaxID=412133 RepID=A2E7S4_TRIV3|nr:hypothetical protein TVAGG3_0239700 [Trichomonas vaginalis G3]EAY11255.1 hypothetical protein TVAG_061590 [Trichomonas vaginalis G3]KAI5553230.1 hypothetical protein TVAGG3_0239700 [Trichomonas vaginalis G3]|eukprot:XP_001323478.1 hypothetical protein [Trichomonas vaginalis G3]
MLQSKLTSTLTYTLTNVVSSYTTITYAIETNEIYYISVSSTPTMFPVYTETDFTTYDTIPSTYPLPESTIILPQDKTKNLLDRTNTYVPTFESKETIVHKPIPYQLTLNSSTLYMYSTETTIYTSTYTADINSSVIFKYTEVTTYTDTIISYNPINHQDGELNVTSYSFIDVNTTTRTVVFNVKETQLEIKTISYKLLNSVLTISSAENNSINTYVWDASQVASGAFYSTYAYFDTETVFVTKNNETYSGTWTSTLVLTLSATKAITDTFVLYPSASQTVVPYNFISISTDTYTEYIIDGASKTSGSQIDIMPSPTPPLGYAWGLLESYKTKYTNTIVTEYIKTFTALNPGENVQMPTNVSTSSFILSLSNNSVIKIETMVPTISTTIYINTGTKLTFVMGDTITYIMKDTNTFLSTIISGTFKYADISFTSKTSTIPKYIETTISSITVTWTSFPFKLTDIPTYTLVPSSIYTVIKLPNETNITTFTYTLVNTITSLRTQLTDGYTMLSTIQQMTASTIIPTNGSKNTYIVSLTLTPAPTLIKTPSSTPRKPIPLRTLDPTMTPKRPILIQEQIQDLL